MEWPPSSLDTYDVLSYSSAENVPTAILTGQERPGGKPLKGLPLGTAALGLTPQQSTWSPKHRQSSLLSSESGMGPAPQVEEGGGTAPSSLFPLRDSTEMARGPTSRA